MKSARMQSRRTLSLHSQNSTPYSHPLRPAWLYKNPEDVSLVFFDLETTGGNPHNAAIIEIAAIRWENGKEKARFQTLVNPKRTIPPRIREMTGIDHKSVQNAPTIEKVMGKLLNFIDNALLISHGVMSDFPFLEHYAQELYQKELKNYYLCTHLLATHFKPELPQKSLSALAKHYGYVATTVHRAEADAETTAFVFWKLYKELSMQGYKTIEDLLKLQGDAPTLARLGSGILEKDVETKAPSTPGIFFLYGASREITYASASQQLKKSLMDLTRLHDEKEFNRILVDTRDFNFERTAHFLEALIKEKELLKRLNLPIDPRKIQKRSENFIQILLSEEMLDSAYKYPNKVPFALPQKLVDTTPFLETPRNSEARLEDGEELHGPHTALSDNEIPIRHTRTIHRKVPNIKLRVCRQPTATSLIEYGMLKEGVGWFFGPCEDVKNTAQLFEEILAALGVYDTKISPLHRLQKLYTFIQYVYEMNDKNNTNGLRYENNSQQKILLKSLIDIFGSKKTNNKDYEILKSYNLNFVTNLLPKSGLVVVTNPEFKELDIAIVVKGYIRLLQRSQPEDSNKLANPRFFTRLFKPFHNELLFPSHPLVFTNSICADIEAFYYWLKNRNGEGEWAAFEELKDLYQPALLLE